MTSVIRTYCVEAEAKAKDAAKREKTTPARAEATECAQ